MGSTCGRVSLALLVPSVWVVAVLTLSACLPAFIHCSSPSLRIVSAPPELQASCQRAALAGDIAVKLAWGKVQEAAALYCLMQLFPHATVEEVSDNGAVSAAAAHWVQGCVRTNW